MRLILLGAPGAGKGTQGALLAKKHGLPQIATGDLLRESVRRGTELGEKARQYMDAGELVPDELILEMMRDVLADAADGFILDGFPRTLEQGRRLDRMLEELGIELDAVLVFRVPEDELIRRLSGRRSCPECNAVYNIYSDPPKVEGICDKCGARLVERADDSADTVRNRLAVYERQTRPLIEYYETTGRRVEYIPADQPVEQVQEAIHTALRPA